MSAGERIFFALGLEKDSHQPLGPFSTIEKKKRSGKKKIKIKTHDMTTPGYLCPICSSRIKPNCINLLPEHFFGSQWPKSQQAALKGGRLEAPVSLSPSPSPSRSRGTGRGRGRGAELNFLPREEKLSFLCRTIWGESRVSYGIERPSE